MTGLGAMMAGGLGKARPDHDFYPTPPECTRALMLAEDAVMPHRIWEPACGDGAIARVLEGYGRSVIAHDLIDRGYGLGGMNFLFATTAPCNALVTNPPFNQAEKFIMTARRLDIDYMALLLKSTYWHAAERRPLFKAFQPARMRALSWRLDFYNLRRPVMECAWFIWDRRAPAGTTVYDVLPRPHAMPATTPLLDRVGA